MMVDTNGYFFGEFSIFDGLLSINPQGLIAAAILLLFIAAIIAISNATKQNIQKNKAK